MLQVYHAHGTSTFYKMFWNLYSGAVTAKVHLIRNWFISIRVSTWHFDIED